MRIKKSAVRGVCALTMIAALAACGSSPPAVSGPTSHAAPARDITAPRDAPSVQTRMICAPEAQEDLAKTLGLDATAVTTPSWRARVYSCDYRYADGSFTLSAHQFVDPYAAAAAYGKIAGRLGRATALQGLGAHATTTKNGSVVVQKDDDVLVVDIAMLPARFGVPADTRANAAISIAATIMGCWTGA